MSDQRHEEKGPAEGGKGKKKEEIAAQVVGAGEKEEYIDNRSKRADTDEFWSSRTSGGRPSKLFGASGTRDTRGKKDVGIALTPNNEEASDEDMDEANSYLPTDQELRVQMRQLATSPTPTDKKNQPTTKKRRFSAIPATPRRIRIPLQGPVGSRASTAASLGDISALFAAAKESWNKEELRKRRRPLVGRGWKWKPKRTNRA